MTSITSWHDFVLVGIIFLRSRRLLYSGKRRLRVFLVEGPSHVPRHGELSEKFWTRWHVTSSRRGQRRFIRRTTTSISSNFTCFRLAESGTRFSREHRFIHVSSFAGRSSHLYSKSTCSSLALWRTTDTFGSTPRVDSAPSFGEVRRITKEETRVSERDPFFWS